MASLLSWLFSNTTSPSSIDESFTLYQHIIEEGDQHYIAGCLAELLTNSGNAWPPKATHADSWPSALKPFNVVYQRIAPFLPVHESSLDDAENRRLINKTRALITALLEEEIHIPDVCETLEECSRYDSHTMPMSGWLGFYSCLASLRHAYRWGVLPVVREAQNEKTLRFPRELDIPWPYIQRRVGITSPGGSLSSNSYYNLDARREIVYSITSGMGEEHSRTELWNGLLFVEVEDKALPMYCHIAQAARFLEDEDYPSTISILEKANEELKVAFKHFYDNMNDYNLVPSLWLPYCQGFQGWTLEGINGVSGGQNILIRTLDSFLGIRPWPTEEEEALHLPLAQRNWLNCLRKFDIRTLAQEKGNEEVIKQLDHLVTQLRLWRMGHMRRMQRYQVYRPERNKMTAGKSLVQDDSVQVSDESAMVNHLKQMLSPSEYEMRKRNEKFAKDAKEGKKPTHMSRQEKLAKRSPIGSWALGVVLFVVLGGVLFELARLIFL
ncbi:hypothetical protein J3R30DRAFT_3710892 [Lentinula aciculospora]|uniref:Uncharacterized protein n=1 Tax=Lentinula aciculospora TaxID=153920 RepID=A0A9W9DHI5_9AGAR|nr:hypothetical protein J3R30DRAFT_3710892 [Lentinula aciculospora]